MILLGLKIVVLVACYCFISFMGIMYLDESWDIDLVKKLQKINNVHFKILASLIAFLIIAPAAGIFCIALIVLVIIGAILAVPFEFAAAICET